MFVMNSSVRNKALSLIRKITELRIEYHNFESVDYQLQTMEAELVKDFNRFLILEENVYFDDLEQGYFSTATNYNRKEEEAPFSKCTKEIKESDILYQKLADPDNIFIIKLFETLLLEMNSKEDLKMENNDESKGSKIRNMIQKFMAKSKGASKKEKSEAFQMTRGVRYFNVFYQIFKYYGLEIYKGQFLPIIKEHIEKGFKEIEHPHVTKAFLVDILAAGLRTCKYFNNKKEEIYTETLSLIFKLLDDCEQIDNTQYIKNSLFDAMKNRDPRRFEEFISSLIENFTLGSQLKARNIIAFISYLSESFKWRGLSFTSIFINKILSTEELAKLSQSSSQTLALLGCKNWGIISQLLAYYISNIQKHVGEEIEDETVKKIYQFLEKALEDLNKIENKEDTQFLLNNSLENIIDLFMKLLSKFSLNNLSVNFIIIGLKVSFFAIEKSVQK